MAYKSPDPLGEELELSDLGGSVRIDGITRKDDREAIYKEIAHLKEGNAGGALGRALGLPYAPDDDDLTAACWAAACVTDPKLTAVEWLQFCGEGYAQLGRILIRCYVCSRLIPDPDAAPPSSESAPPDPESVPDGVEAAKAGLEDAQVTDPLG
jgi:hypothetical protein